MHTGVLGIPFPLNPMLPWFPPGSAPYRPMRCPVLTQRVCATRSPVRGTQPSTRAFRSPGRLLRTFYAKSGTAIAYGADLLCEV
eukprot:1715394-Rhodomonas_salina.1